MKTELLPLLNAERSKMAEKYGGDWQVRRRARASARHSCAWQASNLPRLDLILQLGTLAYTLVLLGLEFLSSIRCLALTPGHKVDIPYGQA